MLFRSDPAYAGGPLIAAYPMYGRSTRATELLLSRNRRVFFHRMLSYPPNGVRGELSESFTRFKLERTRLNRAGIWGGHGSCLHTCIYMAVLMGASAIHLIGCGHSLYQDGGGEHFSAVEDVHRSMRPAHRPLTDPVENSVLLSQTLMFQRLNRPGFAGVLIM